MLAPPPLLDPDATAGVNKDLRRLGRLLSVARDAEVVREPGGRPRLVLHGGVAEEASAQGIATWHLSLSHDGGIATAVVVAES